MNTDTKFDPGRSVAWLERPKLRSVDTMTRDELVQAVFELNSLLTRERERMTLLCQNIALLAQSEQRRLKQIP